MLPSSMFGVLSKISTNFEFKVVFRRYETEMFKAGFLNVELDAGAYQHYLNGGYKEIYLSVGDIPSSEEDWEFYERDAENLIVINGARIDGDMLEISIMRPVNKKNNVKRLLTLIKKDLKSTLNSGNLVVGNTPYPNIYYDDNLAEYKLVNNVEDSDFIYSLSP